MAKRSRPGWQEIPYREGRWIDFSDRDNICIRDAEGRLVATDLYITRGDAEKVKREWRAYLDKELKKHEP